MSQWSPLTPERAATLERELARELSPGHPLAGRHAAAKAQGNHSDDVAFLVDGAELCIVHLTWQIETDPAWPWIKFVRELPEEDED
jgi:hypothetical protein